MKRKWKLDREKRKKRDELRKLEEEWEEEKRIMDENFMKLKEDATNQGVMVDIFLETISREFAEERAMYRRSLSDISVNNWRDRQRLEDSFDRFVSIVCDVNEVYALYFSSTLAERFHNWDISDAVPWYMIKN